MIRKTLFALALIPSLALAQSSGLDLINFAMNDAQLIAGANVNAVKNSPFGLFAVAQLRSAGPNLQEFIAQTGIDPLTDISELVIASNGAAPSTHWLLAAHGSFGTSIGVIEAAAEKSGGSVTHLTGIDVVALGGQTPQGACAGLFLDGLTALIGDCSSVNAAGLSGGLQTSANLAAKARQLRAQGDLWMTSTVPLSQLAGALPANPLSGVLNSGLLQNIQQTSGTVKFASLPQGPAIQVAGEVILDTPRNATALLNVVQFLASLVELNQGANPAAGIISTLAQSLQASTSGSTLNVALTIPESSIEQLIEFGRTQQAVPAKVAAASKNPF